MAATLALDPRPGERVLDMCAAPGSKTTHIGALMENTGELVANDLSRARSHRLRAVLDQLGVSAEVRTGPGEKIGHRNPATFDRVLVDAPCSGEGRMRKEDPRSFSNWRGTLPKRLSSRQKSLLHSAIDAVKPGGVIVYSTCTFAPEENELVLTRALERYGDRVELDEVPVTLPDSLETVREFNGRTIAALPRAIRLAPPNMDGFFIARLRRIV
jgi:16S rRNA (cytosine1407-C5)-methyltransferase